METGTIVSGISSQPHTHFSGQVITTFPITALLYNVKARFKLKYNANHAYFVRTVSWSTAVTDGLR